MHKPVEIAATWQNFHEIVRGLPPPAFDPKTGTAVDWTAYEASLSDVQRQARRLHWVERVIKLFERLWDDKAARQAAHAFAWTNRLVIHEAFHARKTKDEAVELLFEAYETRCEKAA